MKNAIVSYYGRALPVIKFYGMIILSLVLALMLSFFIKTINFVALIPIVILSTILNTNKDFDKVAEIDKFKFFRFNPYRRMKLKFLIYLMGNKFFFLGLFFQLINIVWLYQVQLSLSLVIIEFLILFSNFADSKLSEEIGEIHLIIIIIMITLKMDNFLIVTANAVFCTLITLALFFKHDQTKTSKSSILSKNIRLNLAKISLPIRVLVMNWKYILFLLFSFITSIVVAYKWPNVSYSSSFIILFMLITLYEIIQDINIENQTISYTKMRFYKLQGIKLNRRLFLSKYLLLATITLFLLAIFSVLFKQLPIISFILLFVILLWYLVFEERAVRKKMQVSFRLNIIRSWLPSILISLGASLPYLSKLAQHFR
ncbi:MAG: hypothetical protein LBC17_01180 [Lactobacillaceae bacterium]|jgi:hypothetical protein|nr:hypothetical protein [Lactobacillaceae bacterium]